MLQQLGSKNNQNKAAITRRGNIKRFYHWPWGGYRIPLILNQLVICFEFAPSKALFKYVVSVLIKSYSTDTSIWMVPGEAMDGCSSCHLVSRELILFILLRTVPYPNITPCPLKLR